MLRFNLHHTRLVLSQCFLRRLPAHWSVTMEDFNRNAVFYFGVFWLIQILLIGEPAEAFVAAVSELALSLVFVVAVLGLNGRREAFLPTATLIMGAMGWIGLAALPVLVWLRVAEDLQLVIAFYASWVFVAWGIVVLGHIFRQVLARAPSFGFGLACAYAVETYLGTLVLLVL
ncbi:hypothetical protein MIT9_P2133 [Methylomarinovum caldicuralii]|uniref:Yip1 domain-containing protein n=1 Tax=Methylomarinovum caldicuralii TaxID=438856 RepID=A0AAU9C2D2_9GAMM|nr:hypothetical protein MIT9_P2133 [Methylomarinovum caldicuralii]